MGIEAVLLIWYLKALLASLSECNECTCLAFFSLDGTTLAYSLKSTDNLMQHKQYACSSYNFPADLLFPMLPIGLRYWPADICEVKQVVGASKEQWGDAVFIRQNN